MACRPSCTTPPSPRSGSTGPAGFRACLLLGAGGAASALAYGLGQSGAKLVGLVAEVDGADLVVNTTSVGMGGTAGSAMGAAARISLA